jgi:hypothetical protein
MDWAMSGTDEPNFTLSFAFHNVNLIGFTANRARTAHALGDGTRHDFNFFPSGWIAPSSIMMDVIQAPQP